MLKKLFIAFLILILLACAGLAALFFYRYQIIQYVAQNIILKNLPEYLTIGDVRIEPRTGTIMLLNVRIPNPSGFSGPYMAEIGKITCKYAIRGGMGKMVLEFYDPLLEDLAVHLERRRDGRVNLVEAESRFEKVSDRVVAAPQPAEGSILSKAMGGRSVAEMIKLPAEYTFERGNLAIIDSYGLTRPSAISCENVSAKVIIRLDGSGKKLEALSTQGSGSIQGNVSERIMWVIAWNPKTQKLTMSNRLELSDVNITTFEPYYDKYSPLVFTKGKCSGTLVFDFDNGDIGSTNDVRFSDLSFTIKPGYENAAFWQTTVQDLARYLTSSAGDVYFDFKMKGPMAKPRFYLGPRAKKALTAMTFDQVSGAIANALQQGASPQGQEAAGQAAPRSDIEKAKQYIDIVRELIKKNKK